MSSYIVGIMITLGIALWFYPFILMLEAEGNATSLQIKVFWQPWFLGWRKSSHFLVLDRQGPYISGKKPEFLLPIKEIFPTIRFIGHRLHLHKWQFYIFPFSPFYWQVECIIKVRLGDIILIGIAILIKIIKTKARR